MLFWPRPRLRHTQGRIISIICNVKYLNIWHIVRIVIFSWTFCFGLTYISIYIHISLCVCVWERVWCIGQGSPERQNQLDVYEFNVYKSLQKELYYTGLARMLMEAGKSKSVGRQPGDPGERVVQLKSKGSFLENSLFLGQVCLFYSGLQLIAWGPSALWRAIVLLRVHWFKC